MFQSQNLPWRAALRQASRSNCTKFTTRSSSRYLPAQCTASLVARPLHRCPSPPAALFAYRNFSTSLSKQKEKDPKTPPEPLDEGAAEETDELKKLKEQQRSREVEGKSDTPEPIPPRTGSGRGSAAGGGTGGSDGGDGGGKKRKGSERALVKPTIPDVYPQVMAIPLVKRPLFPGFYKAITIRDREVGQAIADMVKRGQPYIGAFMFKDEGADKDVIDDPNEVYDVGTFCQVTSAFPVGADDNFAMTCVLYPHRRIKMTGLKPPAQAKEEPSVAESTLDESSETSETDAAATQSKGDVVASFEESTEETKTAQGALVPTILKGRKVSIADVDNMVEEPFDLKSNKTIQVLVNEIVNTFKGVALLNPLFRDHVSTFSVHTTMNVGEDPVKLADFAAAVAQAESHELQDALEEMDIEKRLSKALELLKKELISAELQKKVADDVNARVTKKHREYMLMEQMKGIKRELGIESDGKDKLIEKFNEKANKLAMPEAVRKVFEEEMSKLQGLEPNGSEFNVTRNYLDWLTQLPWGLRSAENFGIQHAREVLDEDHHGLKDVKDRILEFIAVGKLRGTVEGKILCLVGPPEQNNSFLDHYLDVPVDLSKVLFVCTANMDETIPQPLLDRMEVIRLSGYVSDEKIAIAEKYLSPAAKEMSGLKDADVVLEKDAIVELINKYCRESGVRNLKKHIEKVYRKSALKIVTDVGEEALPETAALTEEGKAAQQESNKNENDPKETPKNIEEQTTEKPRVALKVPDSVHVSINKDNLKDYVGPPIFTSDRLYDFTPPGVAMGLAWTSMGGSALYIESILQNALSASSSPGLERSGSLRDVMKESTGVAYSFAKSIMARDFSKNKFFEHARIHLHCPEGGTPKDGPSAGITMATSLLSLALNKKIRDDVAMTGELTLTGKVLRIGGLREKTVAARRAGAKTVIFPHDNMSDWLELPENIKEGIEGRPVSWYREVFDIVFPDLDKEAANKMWEKELKSKKGDRKKREQKRKEEEEEESGDDDD
ncbi:hypothetical protein GGP41_003112 [Bipolaris sorokiniana]|uniref:Lon protease homolog, mitochondrial n=1 Tax=Cochliobolus sativus TaxID=45130 RepID=A0A8H5ZC47_COCSA|nr:hypothetical protein GGP41_003112 [Bipolaris sorokiniana]